MGGRTPGSKLDDLVLELGGPKVLFVPTAAAESDERLVSFYEIFGHRAEATHAAFFPWPRPDLREHVLSRDAIYVAGGNTANMLAVWRVHGFDAILREAWEAGVLLAGWSAGMLCWFEACITDSFGPELSPMEDGLGFLPGSACPHFDSEARRRAVYTEAVARGFPPGYAADDDAALIFEGKELRESVSARNGAGTYRVSPAGVEPIPDADPVTRTLREIWDAQAAQWGRWVRTPAADRTNTELNVPRLLELLPPPGRRTLDLCCGEGRIGRVLGGLGHHVVGVDASPGMVALAAESQEALVADAAALPFEDGAFDLVTVFMALQDVDDLAGTVGEAGRVLERAGALVFCIPHPLMTAGVFAERRVDAPFLVDDYLQVRRVGDVAEHDGLRIWFAHEHRPLEAYARALESADLAIGVVREVLFPPELWRDDAAGRWARIPSFLHVRAVKR